jgi:peptidase inhibitor family I36
VTAVTYVTIYDQAAYAGSFMQVSQDYSVLALIGWNDRISSFKGRNSETGSFYTDWFYGGSAWSFCCNVNQPVLNAYDNTFSSIIRT